MDGCTQVTVVWVTLSPSPSSAVVSPCYSVSFLFLALGKGEEERDNGKGEGRREMGCGKRGYGVKEYPKPTSPSTNSQFPHLYTYQKHLLR